MVSSLEPPRSRALTSIIAVQLRLMTTLFNRSTYTYDGCNGGFPTTAYDYVAVAGGLTTEALYPYDISTSLCDLTKNKYAVTVVMSYRVIGEQAMIDQVLAGRTLSVAVDASDWGQYRSGIFAGCPANYNVNHAVNIVGVNVPEGYWIVRNSWGTWWGDQGYIKLAMVRIFRCNMHTLQVTLPQTSDCNFSSILRQFCIPAFLILFVLSIYCRDPTCAESTTGPRTQTPRQ
jgi:Papain family cysteine protease